MDRGRRDILAATFAVLAVAGSTLDAQQAPSAGPRTGTLVIAGDVKTPLTLKVTDLKAMPRTSVRIDEDGRQVTYEGVLAGELLKRAGAASGPDLRGPAVAAYVLATGNDGYQALYSIAELDPAFTGSEIIVADSVEGKALFDYQGPLRLIAPRDTRGARSVRMLEKLELVRLKK